MKLGTLDFIPVIERYDLVAAPVAEALKAGSADEVYVSAIDPDLADTAAFCEQYKIGLDASANCVVLEAKRTDRTWYVACMVLATSRADVNGIIRRYLDARKISFAPMHTAVSLSAMEYGGITPIGLPGEWPVLVDTAVANAERVIIGSGIRGSKLLLPGSAIAHIPGAHVLSLTRQLDVA